MAHLIVVSYDIPDDRRRLRLANTLKDFGIRVQYSVFECRLEPDTRTRSVRDDTRDGRTDQPTGGPGVGALGRSPPEPPGRRGTG